MDQSLVALMSGGLDSATMVARALRAGWTVHPLYVRQGALWEDAEEAAIRRFLDALSHSGKPLAPLSVVRVDWPARYASRWALDEATPPPGARSPDGAVYLPGRNLTLLLQGALLAQSVGAGVVQIGLLKSNPFPDSRSDFFRAFEQTFRAATGTEIRVEAPLATMSKTDVIRAGANLPLELTFSCLRPVGALHCGGCNKCAERRSGFEGAGVPDPTQYAQPMAS